MIFHSDELSTIMMGCRRIHFDERQLLRSFYEKFYTVILLLLSTNNFKSYTQRFSRCISYESKKSTTWVNITQVENQKKY